MCASVCVCVWRVETKPGSQAFSVAVYNQATTSRPVEEISPPALGVVENPRTHTHSPHTHIQTHTEAAAQEPQEDADAGQSRGKRSAALVVVTPLHVDNDVDNVYIQLANDQLPLNHTPPPPPLCVCLCVCVMLIGMYMLNSALWQPWATRARFAG